jgi:hypothetical protein
MFLPEPELSAREVVAKPQFPGSQDLSIYLQCLLKLSPRKSTEIGW